MMAAKPPKQIKLALQGGGAKIFALVAALEALEEQIQHGRLQISAVAGTSAGAIVGTLFAFGIPASTIRAALHSLDYDAVLGRRWFNRWLYRRFPVAQGLLRLARNRPIADSRPIRTLLEKHLILDGPRTATCPLFVVAADVSNRKEVSTPVAKGEQAESSLIDAVLDSCALPFFFRVASSSGQALHLDGGLATNLPSDLLFERGDIPGDVVAVSFRPDVHNRPKSHMSLALSTLDTAISASVSRAKHRAGVIVHELDPCGLGTFSFGRAKAVLDGGKLEAAAYKLARESTKEFVANLVNAKARSVPADLWSRSDLSHMTALRDYYRVQHETRPYKLRRRTVEIEAFSLLQSDEPDYGTLDLVRSTIVFEPSQHDIDSLIVHIVVVEAEHCPHLITYDLVDAAGKEVKVGALPVKDRDRPLLYGLLLHFLPPLRPGTTDFSPPFTLVTEYRLPSAMPLLQRMMSSPQSTDDEISCFNRRVDGQVDEVELLLHLPKSYGALEELTLAGAVPPKRARPTAHNPAPCRGHFSLLRWCATGVPDQSKVGLLLKKKAP